MGRATGWKVATAVLAVVTLALGATLVSEGRDVPERSASPTVPTVDAPEVPQRDPSERRRATPTPVPDEPAPVAPEPQSFAPEPQSDDALRDRERLAELSVEEVVRQELLAGGTAPADVVVARLLRDRDRATDLMLDLFAKRNAPGANALAPHFHATLLAVAGDVAATPMREEWRQTRQNALMVALVRFGDAETLRTLDEDHRSPHPRRRENPYLLVDLGEPARAMVWGWIEDPAVERSVRETAIAGMWVRGSDADRRRLWTQMDDTIRVVHFAPHAVRDDNDWSGQLKGRVEAMLVHDDPWMRVHGARAALENRFEWGDDLAQRAAAITAEYAERPAPEGRDEFEWKETLRWIGIHRSRLPGADESEND